MCLTERTLPCGTGQGVVRVLAITSRHFGWAGLRETLRNLPNVRLVGETQHTGKAMEMVERLRPDAILASVDVVRPCIVALVEKMRGVSGGGKIILLGDDAREDLASHLCEIPIDGYLVWRNLNADVLRISLSAVIEADLRIVSTELVGEILNYRTKQVSTDAAGLTEQEMEALTGLAQGLSAVIAGGQAHIDTYNPAPVWGDSGIWILTDVLNNHYYYGQVGEDHPPGGYGGNDMIFYEYRPSSGGSPVTQYPTVAPSGNLYYQVWRDWLDGNIMVFQWNNTQYYGDVNFDPTEIQNAGEIQNYQTRPGNTSLGDAAMGDKSHHVYSNSVGWIDAGYGFH